MKRAGYFSRRQFLAGLGASAGLVPLLQSDFARAQTAGTTPRRLLVVCQSNGIVHDNFWPTGTGKSLANHVFPAVTKPLEPHKDDLTFIAGLEYKNFQAFYTPDTTYFDGHQSLPHALTGRVGVVGENSTTRHNDLGGIDTRPTGGGPSLDQLYADELAKSVSLAFPVLTVGVRSDTVERTMGQVSFKAADTPNQTENDPYALFARLFASVGMSETEIDKARRERRSILDYVGKSIERWSGRLGSEDRTKVAQHLSAIRTIERGLSAGVSAACQKPSLGAPVTTFDDGNIPALLSAQMDNVVNAMACDLTRSATLMIGHGGGDFTMSWLGADFDGPALAGNAGLVRTHHDLAHAEASVAEAKRLKIIAETWFMQQFAALIERFKAIPEGDGTMLDNTVILWLNTMGTGYDHSIKGPPWILAGKGGGGLRTGQILRLGEWASKGQGGKLVPQNAVLGALYNTLLDRDDTSFGDAQFGEPLSELST